MTKKGNTILFTLISTVANIIMTLLIIMVLCLLSFVIMNFGFKIHNGQAYQIVWMACFLGGLVLGMFLFAKICGYVIEKFNLDKKMDAHVVGKYLPGGKKARYESSDEEPKHKTVMPASVLPKEDKWNEEHEENSYAENMQTFDASNIPTHSSEDSSENKSN